MPVVLTEETVHEKLTPGKFNAEQKVPLFARLDEASSLVASELVTVPVDQSVDDLRTLDRNDSAPIEPVARN